MKALILVGGYGTRLRPLTLSVPKPLIHFCNKSIVEHQIAALEKAGVNHVILAVAYQPSAMMEAIRELEIKFNIKITCSREEEPLGTGGPIGLARDLLLDPSDESDSFFVFNSDVICEFPLVAMLNTHKNTKADCTILVTKVSDTSNFGVVVHNEEGKVQRFVEKPKEYVGDFINAGLYVIRKTIIDKIPARPTSLEKETFPMIAESGGLYCFRLHGYWADIGQPGDFLNGIRLYLESIQRQSGDALGADASRVPELSVGESFVGNVLVDPTAVIGKGSMIGPDVTIGPDCIVGDGCRLANCAVMAGVKIGNYTWISDTIVGWQSIIGSWVRIEGLTVVGEDVQIKNECYVYKSFILPHKAIASSLHTAGTIIM